MADWLHCNTCFRQPGDGGNYYLTCCGHVYCEQCGSKGWKEKCLLCGTGNPAAFKLTADLPSSLATFFKNPVPMLKKAVSEINEVMSAIVPIVQAIEFQNSQRIRFSTRLQTTIKQQREVVQKLNNDIRDKMTVMLKQTEREKATLKEQLNHVIEENKNMKQMLSEGKSNTQRTIELCYRRKQVHETDT